MNRLSIVDTQAKATGVSAAVQRQKNSQPPAGGAPAPARAAHASFSFGNAAVYSPAGRTAIQAKLTVGPVDDAYEREADHVAAQVVAGLDAPHVQRQGEPEDDEERVQAKPAISALQRQPAPEEEDDVLQAKHTAQRKVDGSGEADPTLEAAIQQQRGGGHALLDATRHSMEQAIGADFGRVRVHSDAQSDRLSRSIQARAFTTGQDIFMRQGEYRPRERSGQELLAHELTHVVQQNGRSEPRLQRYADQPYFTSTWRQSDDLTIAARTGYPNHELYARAGKAALANAQLRAVNSGIELVETTMTDSFWEGSYFSPVRQRTLKKIEAKNLKNKTQGDAMLLYADCGKSNAAVVGGSSRQAIYDAPGQAGAKVQGSPVTMRTTIAKALLDQLIADPNNAGQLISLILAKSSGMIKEDELKALATSYGKAKTNAERETIETKYVNKLDEVADAYWSYYNGLPEAEREQIDAKLKINRYASPSVGQGYTTASGGPSAGKSTWNFHWGGVVMTSDDGKDNVVLENYATGNPAEENTKWTFDIYGTQKKNQTFHERHKATQQHGQTPTTMAIEKVP
jgi:hypothetical protein